MSRAKIMAETLAHLEAERFQPVKPTPRPELEPITAEQAAEHRAILIDALSGDPHVIAWRERQAAA